ncbi:NADPH-dependent glutamate synthase beta chain and related oxidoreductase [Candidatus Scalindua japonica]|uniref:NADPH-dependent glutamate synthase beta chain and related oxidoreductase n=1 Tax=Candidatus Scalindua japonica TaxID=1284222 RepID=A0A286TXP5_9BACT|nr:FAD-dependent oxidoreductase [Candidatus Scalindua japonica]GAX60650.1 NADPH-dependent glutamate synthase beta chain and related oxidoreductase [Candidatus Scalindua japonica]
MIDVFGDKSKINRYIVDEEAPCIVACPIRQDARDYIQLIARGRFSEAIQVVAERNALPSACGRICTHPCETECRRNVIDKPIAIAWLKRFLADGFLNDKTKGIERQAEIKYSERIAIIGAGPAGLAAAKDLALLGYQCTIFEAHSGPGGMLRMGVPTYRLPREFLDKDIGLIADLGVEIKYNMTVGEDISFDDLKNDFAITFLAVGLPITRRLPIEGTDLDGVQDAISFLKSANCHHSAKVGNSVLVIGGGAVAMDCARTALRLGPKEVNIVCLEHRNEMPTSDYEIEETLQEKAILHTSVGPKRIIGEGGKVAGLETLKVKSVFDSEGRFNPSFHQGSESIINADTIILAIGQASDLSFLEGHEEIGVTGGGTIAAEADTLSTGMPGVFAGGDVVLGRGTLTMGLGHGKKAALSIHNYLRKTSRTDHKFRDVKPIDELSKTETRVEKIKTEERDEMPVLDPNTRTGNWDEVELGFTEEIAVREAMRCMNCGNGATVSSELCIACLTCVRVCPFEIPKIKEDENFAHIGNDCQSCGMCVVECPAKAIEFKGQYEDMGKDQLNDAFKEAKTSEPLIINFYCSYNLDLALSKEELPENIRQINLLSLGKLSPGLILDAFEKGADGVLITSCDDMCHFGDSCHAWAEQRAETAMDFLVSIGIEKERIKHHALPDQDGNGFLQTANQLIDEIKHL